MFLRRGSLFITLLPFILLLLHRRSSIGHHIILLVLLLSARFTRISLIWITQILLLKVESSYLHTRVHLKATIDYFSSSSSIDGFEADAAAARWQFTESSSSDCGTLPRLRCRRHHPLTDSKERSIDRLIVYFVGLCPEGVCKELSSTPPLPQLADCQLSLAVSS